jgi:hypothetical protein
VILGSLRPARSALAWLRVNAMVQDLHRRLARPAHPAPPAWRCCSSRPDSGIDSSPVPVSTRGLRLEAHASGPRDGDVVLVTGEPVLKALLDGRLDWQRAIDDRLVAIAGESHLSERLPRTLRIPAQSRTEFSSRRSSPSSVQTCTSNDTKASQCCSPLNGDRRC